MSVLLLGRGMLLILLALIFQADGPLPCNAGDRRPTVGEKSPPPRAAAGLFDSSNTETLGLEPVQGTDTLLFQATADSYKFCHHPNLVVYDGTLYCMWSNGIVGEDAAGQRLLYSHTADGIAWTDPVLLADAGQRQGICVAAGFHVAPDNLVAYYTTTGGTNFHPDTCLVARTSRDGRTWTPPQRIASGFFIEAPRQLPGGRLLLGGEHVGDARQSKRMQFPYSVDPNGLEDWKTADVHPPELSVYGYTEPSFFLRPDETVVATLRNYSGYLHASASMDNGETWSTPRQTNFPDSTARASAGNLPDGTAYLINNPMPQRLDRSLLTIALSEDGILFDRAFLVRGEPTHRRYEGKHKLDGWQYPHAAVWKDALHVAYSINKEDVGVTRIKLADLCE